MLYEGRCIEYGNGFVVRKCNDCRRRYVKGGVILLLLFLFFFFFALKRYQLRDKKKKKKNPGCRQIHTCSLNICLNNLRPRCLEAPVIHPLKLSGSIIHLFNLIIMTSITLTRITFNSNTKNLLRQKSIHQIIQSRTLKFTSSTGYYTAKR